MNYSEEFHQNQAEREALVVISVLDVIDNFTSPSGRDLNTAPGSALEEFGDHVRYLAAAQPTDAPQSSDSVYLGGWPSANFWAVGGDLLLSSLLYSPAVLVRDPISDWFSDEQYLVRHKMSARPGYLDAERRPNVAATRAFLTNVVPQLRAWRPLIESGVVKLVTSEAHAFANSSEIGQLQERLESRLLTDPVSYAARFRPGEIAVEDNVRGSFVFAGGDQLTQLRKAQADGIYHFAREFVLATNHGATYTAPFRHERYLCREGLNTFISPSQKVVEALLRSELPVLNGLTPGIIAKLHEDDGFASFREKLHVVYAHVPLDESDENIRRYIHEQESALLQPLLRDAEKSADRGPIGKLGVTLTNNAFALSAALATGLIFKDPGAATAAGVTGIAAQAKLSEKIGAPPAQRVWNTLMKHSRSARNEMRGVEVTSTGAPDRLWGIPTAASMDVTIADGELLIDHFLPAPRPAAQQSTGFIEGPYRICACGSGLKFKFCCKTLFDAVRR